MRKILSKFFRKKSKLSNNFISLPSSEVYKAITKKISARKYTQSQKDSDRINSYLLWENFTFDHPPGSMEFSNDAEGFALALDREAIRQAEAMVKLNNEMTVITKILKRWINYGKLKLQCLC